MLLPVDVVVPGVRVLQLDTPARLAVEDRERLQVTRVRRGNSHRLAQLGFYLEVVAVHRLEKFSLLGCQCRFRGARGWLGRGERVGISREK